MLIPKRLKDILVNVKGNLNYIQDPVELTGFGNANRTFVPAYSTVEFEIDVNDYDTWVCCRDWMVHRECINIGPFESLCIDSLNQDYMIKDIFKCNAVFTAKGFNSNNGNWRDWFIDEDTEYKGD